MIYVKKFNRQHFFSASVSPIDRKPSLSITTPIPATTSSDQIYSVEKTLIAMFKSKIAIAQLGSLLYNTQGTLSKLESAVAEASSNNAHLILFPEAFIGGYPKALTFGISLGKRSDEGRDEFKKYYETAIEYDGPESNQIAEIARTYNMIVVVGVVERDGGTLYCSVSFLDF